MSTEQVMSQDTIPDQEQVLRVYNSMLAEKSDQTYEQQIKQQLIKLGAVHYDLLLPETRTLHKLVRKDEKIKGVVYGRYHQTNGSAVGRGVLVATDRRVMLVDKKPLFVRCDEIDYRALESVTYTKIAIAGSVSLRTDMGKIIVRTFNQACARNFIKAVEDGIYSTQGPGNHK